MNLKIKEAFKLVYTLQPQAMRKFTPVPGGQEIYWTHLYSVYKSCVYWGYTDENLLLAAILHDSVEDTDYTLEDVKQNFGEEVSKIVDLCTKKKDYKTFDAHDEEEYFSKIWNCSDNKVKQFALIIKLVDRLDNLMGAAFIENKDHIQQYIDEIKKRCIQIAKELGREEQLNQAIQHTQIALES